MDEQRFSELNVDRECRHERQPLLVGVAEFVPGDPLRDGGLDFAPRGP